MNANFLFYNSHLSYWLYERERTSKHFIQGEVKEISDRLLGEEKYFGWEKHNYDFHINIYNNVYIV